MEISRLERGSSLRLPGSKRSLLISESVSSECARVAGYERLSKSMRMSAEEDEISYTRRKAKAFGFISKVFRFSWKISRDDETSKQAATQEVKRKKKRPSWFPDPERRWPVQGW